MFRSCFRTVAVILLSDFSSGKAALLSRGKHFQRTDDKKCPQDARRGSTHLPWVSNWLLTRWSRRRNAKHAVRIPQPPFGVWVLDIISALRRGWDNCHSTTFKLQMTDNNRHSSTPFQSSFRDFFLARRQDKWSKLKHLLCKSSDVRKIAKCKIQTLRSTVPNSNIGVDRHPKESFHEHNTRRMIKIPSGQKPRRSDDGGVTFERN